jgi:hypothetical protein
MATKMPTLNFLAKLSIATGVVLSTASPGHAFVNFSLEESSSFNTPSAEYAESSSGINLTIDNAVGTDLPTDGGIVGNGAGLCSFIQNSTAPGGFRCGYSAGSGATASSSLTSFDFTFSSDVFLRSFNVSALNGVNSALLSFGAQNFNITSTGVQNFSGNYLVSQGTPVTLSTSSVVFADGLGGAVRISDLQVEEVPGPLPLLGAASAFAYSRKLRKKISAS